MSVNKILARDRELRHHATARPWHESGQGIRLRIEGPLPEAPVVVDPYAPNPQDAPLILHRVNTFEELEREIERLRMALIDARARIVSMGRVSTELPAEHVLESFARDLEARISDVLGERRAGITPVPSSRRGSRQGG